MRSSSELGRETILSAASPSAFRWSRLSVLCVLRGVAMSVVWWLKETGSFIYKVGCCLLQMLGKCASPGMINIPLPRSNMYNW